MLALARIYCQDYWVVWMDWQRWWSGAQRELVIERVRPPKLEKGLEIPVGAGFVHSDQKEKKGLQPKSCKPLILLVPGPGFEPGTLGFSVRCSTD